MTITLLTCRFVRLAIAAVTLAVALTTAVSAQQGTSYEIVSSFNGIFTAGRGPWTTLIEGSDGNLYGTTLIEGRFGAGTIFRIDPAGVLTTVHHFSERDGSAPAGLIQAADGRLYGTTEFGGSSDLGTVFRLEPTGGVTTLYSFSDEDGTSQPTVLVQGSSGTIFGVTRGQFSTVFRLNPGGGITPLHRFESSEEGSTATALIEAADGNLYGAMQTLGPLGGGTIYKLDASGTLTTLHAFSGADGSGPFDLIQGHDGDFYGVTVNEATIFKMDAAGSVTTLHRFPAGTTSHVLIQASDGSFYVNTEAAIVKLDPAGTVTTLHAFTGDDGRSIGALTQASDGNLYGTKLLGGTALGEGGTIFTLDLAGTFAVLHHFGRNPGPARPLAPVTEGSDGRLYGTTSTGGQSDFGTVFTIEPSGAGTVLHSFSGSDGRGPGAGLVQATDGRFYGTTSGSFGFAGDWTIFAIDTTGALTTRYRFPPPPNPQNPSSTSRRPNGLIEATDGLLYGTTDNRAFSFLLSGAAPVLRGRLCRRLGRGTDRGG